MKKNLLLLLCLCLLLSACGTKIGGSAASLASEQAANEDSAPAGEPGPQADPGESGDTPDDPTPQSTLKALPYVLDQMEYVLYQNIFFNKQADEYVNKQYTKTGVLVRLQDRWNDRTRYYVWGYMDATKCCDWQWEFVPNDPSSLPANGSLVTMTGRLEYDEQALDKYWYTNASVEVQTDYGRTGINVDMATMDATLERVQLLNVLYYSDDFEGQTVRLYGRVQTPKTLQHPYYDNAWTLDFSTEEEVPAIGTMVMLTGTWSGGMLTEVHIEETKNY